MSLRSIRNLVLKYFSMVIPIVCSFYLCSPTFGQRVPDPLFHFSFDGHADDSFGRTVMEAQKSFLWRNPVVEAKEIQFDGNALFVSSSREEGSYAFRTPSLDYDEFTVLLRIKPVCRPNDRINLVTGGYWMRWFTMFREDNGNLCVTLNNERIVNEIPVSIDPDKWSLIVCSVDLNRKVLRTYVDGKAYPDVRLPDDFQLTLLTPKWRKKFELTEKHWDV